MASRSENASARARKYVCTDVQITGKHTATGPIYRIGGGIITYWMLNLKQQTELLVFVWIIVHSCHRQYNTKQFCLSPSFAVQSSTAHMPLLTQPARADSDCWNIDYFQQMRWGSKLYKHTHKHTVTRQNASISLNNCLTQAKDIQLECQGRLKAYNNVLSWLQQQNDALIYGWSQVGWHFNTDPASNQPNNPPANYPVTVNKK